jgi:DivIVA domain-containing protein
MGHLLLLLVVALVAAALVFGVTVLIMGGDQGMEPAEPDGRAVPLPGVRPLTESDLADVRFDTVLRGYRMSQVDQALRRAAYDIGYKEELIGVLEAEVEALRDGRTEEADRLRQARLRAAGPATEVEAPFAEPGAESPSDAPVEEDSPVVASAGDGAGEAVDEVPVGGGVPETDGVIDDDAMDHGASGDGAGRGEHATVESAK